MGTAIGSIIGTQLRLKLVPLQVPLHMLQDLHHTLHTR